jgi:hypothetical protein
MTVLVNVQEAAERWARTWERAWPTKDADAIAALYADGAAYRAHAFRDPEPGGARAADLKRVLSRSG